MFMLGAKARDTIDSPAPRAKAPAIAQPDIAAKPPAAIIAEPADAIPATNAKAILKPF